MCHCGQFSDFVTRFSDFLTHLETFQKPSKKISFLDKPYVQRLSHDQLELKAVGNTGQCFLLLLLFCLFCLYFNGLSEMWGHKT